jgi:hypothetical protein
MASDGPTNPTDNATSDSTAHHALEAAAVVVVALLVLLCPRSKQPIEAA